jgi:hypothetical protein
VWELDSVLLPGRGRKLREAGELGSWGAGVWPENCAVPPISRLGLLKPTTAEQTTVTTIKPPSPLSLSSSYRGLSGRSTTL